MHCDDYIKGEKLTTYSITKNPTRTLSIIDIAATASGYSSGVPDSAKDWNSGKVPRTKVKVETRTTPNEVKAITLILEKNRKKNRLKTNYQHVATLWSKLICVVSGLIFIFRPG